jgi:hypothetical protein
VKLITEIVFRNRGGGDEVRGEDEERRREDEDCVRVRAGDAKRTM